MESMVHIVYATHFLCDLWVLSSLKSYGFQGLRISRGKKIKAYLPALTAFDLKCINTSYMHILRILRTAVSPSSVGDVVIS